MVIQFLNGGRGREINAAIMAQALISGYKLYSNNPFVRFRVEEWDEFIHIVWLAYFACSHDGRGSLMSEKLSVGITMEDGRNFHTQVWYDEDDRCLRYVSLV